MRDRAWETYFALILSTAERRLTADRLDRFSVRVIAHGTHVSLYFYLSPSIGLLLTVWTRFSVRVIAYERHFAAEHRLTRAIFGTPSRSSYERACWLEIFVFVFFVLVLHGFVPR